MAAWPIPGEERRGAGEVARLARALCGAAGLRFGFTSYGPAAYVQALHLEAWLAHVDGITVIQTYDRALAEDVGYVPKSLEACRAAGAKYLPAGAGLWAHEQDRAKTRPELERHLALIPPGVEAICAWGPATVGPRRQQLRPELIDVLRGWEPPRWGLADVRQGDALAAFRSTSTSPQGWGYPSRMVGPLTPNLHALVTNYGIDGPSRWSNNILASDAHRQSSGRISRGPLVEAVDPASLAALAALADAAAALAEGLETGMGSNGGEGLEAFYATATTNATVDRISEAEARALFGDALFPGAIVCVEPLSTVAAWWSLVREDAAEVLGLLDRWRAIVDWFDSQEAFVETAFVAIDKPDTLDMEGGCVFPRLWLGRTRDGGLAGLLGVVVDT